MKAYVASSWRNTKQPGVVRLLRACGYDVYDFKNPPDGRGGFHWSDIDPAWKSWSPEEYRAQLSHPLATNGYESDMSALIAADLVCLVMPCGRSAHLELGFACLRARTIIYLDTGEPELMYLMADRLVTNDAELTQAALELCRGSMKPRDFADFQVRPKE